MGTRSPTRTAGWKTLTRPTPGTGSARQNEFTQAELSGYPERQWFQTTMSAILARPRAGVPAKKAGWYLVGRNDGTQAQDVVYVAESLEELLAGGRVLIDPNTLSADGTDSLGSFTVSPDGKYFAYGVNESGSDWTTFRLLDIATGTPVDDVVTEAKFCEATWLPDSSAYLYLHYPASGRSEGTETKTLSGWPADAAQGRHTAVRGRARAQLPGPRPLLHHARGLRGRSLPHRPHQRGH